MNVAVRGAEVDQYLGFLPVCGERTNRYARWILVLTFIGDAIYNVAFLPSNRWDYLLLSGLTSLWFGLLAVAPIDAAFDDMVVRLIERDVLPAHSDTKALLTLLHTKADFVSRRVALITALAMLIAFFINLVLQDSRRPDIAALSVFATLASYVAGSYLGRMVSYGRLGSSVTALGLTVRVFPEHVDGVGGLKPVGDFFSKQAMVAAIPALFLGIWSLIFPIWKGRPYGDWSGPYLGLLVVALAIMLLSFVVPMLKFHEFMAASKRAALLQADKLSRRIREERERAGDDDESGDDSKRLDALRERYWRIENMPVWPLHPSTLQSFRRTYVVLTTPVIMNLARHYTSIGRFFSE